jgi:hypothetical protein
MICFLGIFAYVGILEKQKQAELKQTEISETEEEINWGNIAPEYFLSEDIFNTNAKTALTEYDMKKSAYTRKQCS